MAPNKIHMTTPNLGPSLNFVDKRRATSVAADGTTHSLSKSVAAFTANAGGTTSTIVGANAVPNTNDNNVIRRGEEFQLFTGAGAKKEETVFTVTNVAVGASTTVSFTPNAATATASGDVARLVGLSDVKDTADMTARLSTLGYTDSQINSMTINDMIFALRQADNPDGI